MTDSNKLTEEEFIAAHKALGPLPPRWRWIARRRWYAAEWALYQRSERWPKMLEHILAEIRSLPDADSRRRR